MTRNIRSLEDYHAEQDRVERLLKAGTEDLRAAAKGAVRAVIRDEASAMGLLWTYNQFTEYRASHGGENPEGVDERIMGVVDAIDALKAAEAQNMMADSELSEAWGYDHAAMAESDLIQIVPYSVINDAWHDLVREQR